MAANEIPSPAKLFLAAAGKQILTYRETVGLSLVDLAGKIGITPDKLDAIEHGWEDVSNTTLQAIAEGLGASAAELLNVGGTELGLSF